MTATILDFEKARRGESFRRVFRVAERPPTIEGVNFIRARREAGRTVSWGTKARG